MRMISHNQKPATPWLLIVLLFILSTGSIILGYLYYRNQKISLLNDKKQELSAIADLKVRQIAQWRNERLSDAMLISENTPFLKMLWDFMYGTDSKNQYSEVISNLNSICRSSDFKNVLLLDSTGNIKTLCPRKEAIMGVQYKETVHVILKNRKSYLSDLHETRGVNYIHFDLVIPLIKYSGKDAKAFGMLMFRVDPREVFFPLVQDWPVPSKTAESFLVRQEGDKVVYLNELRFKKNAKLTFKKSISDERLPAAMALRGIESTIDGIDYRGAPVVASMKKVPGCPWYIVAKMDHHEIIRSLDDQMAMIIVIIILFILTMGLLFGIIEWNDSVRFYRGKYEAEVDRLALRKHFDYILKYANDIIFLTDGNFEIIEANDRASEVYQLKRNELIGMNVSKIIAPGTSDNLDDTKKTLEKQGSSTFESFHIRKDGTIIPVEVSAREVEIEGIKYYQAICRDITERKISEEILRESEERFRKIFEESPIGIAMTGKDMVILRANGAFCRMLGYSEEELKSFTFKDFTHPDYAVSDDLDLLRLVAQEIPVYHTEKQYVRKDNSVIWGASTISIIRNNNDEVEYFLAMIEDVTLRKQAEDKLENSFSLIKATLESTADGILVVDRKGRIVQSNEKFSRMWKIPDDIMRLSDDEQVIRLVRDQLIKPEKFINQLKNLYTNPGVTTFDLLEFKDGRVFEHCSQPQKISGKCVGRVWSFRDITQRKQAEAELIAAKEKAEENDRLKTAFLHNVSHEIRTPMNAIIGFSALLNEPDNTEDERRQFIDIIFQSGSQLLSIINDIVDIANVESGQVKLNIKEMNLNSSLKSLNEQFSYKEQQGVLSINLQTGLPDSRALILTDDTKLIQILSNLINNATKFTKEGSINFGYTPKDDTLLFFVEDTGIGIPPEHLEKIFERFYQVDNMASRKFSGTGLGLSICKAYVELLGGKIWVNSRPGEGTVFHFTVPYEQVP